VLAVLAVVELAAAVYVVANNKAPKEQTPNPAARQQPTSVVTQSSTSSSPGLGVEATNASRGSSSDQVVVAYLGDDWTAGTGASRRARRFTTLVSSALGVTERNFGVAGTGYAKPSDIGGIYRSRIAAIVAADPQVVVVSGGRNDRSDSPDTVANAIHRLFATLRTKLPSAVLIAVAPFWGDSDLPPEIAALGDDVYQGVTDAGGTYLHLEDPVHGHPEFMADDADPNNQGYAAIAAALEPLLAPLLPR
jgi:lysophospholipase L1-like esterase